MFLNILLFKYFKELYNSTKIIECKIGKQRTMYL